MKWIKLHTTLHHNAKFRRLSAGARLVFYVLLEVAGDLEQGGAIAVSENNPLTLAEIATAVAVTPEQAKKGLDALVDIGFLTIRSDSAYVVEKFEEKTGAKDKTGADRQRRHRQRSPRNGVTPAVTTQRDGVTVGNGTEEEVEVEEERVRAGRTLTECSCASENPMAIAPAAFVALEDAVAAFLLVFANAKSPAAQDRQRPRWLGWLREMRGAGYGLEQIWAACSVAHVDARHAPLVQSVGIWLALKALDGGKVVHLGERSATRQVQAPAVVR